MYSRFRSIVIGGVALCVLAHPGVASPLSQAEATVRAQAFLRSTGTASAASKRAESHLKSAPAYSGKYWRDRYPFVTDDNARVEVDASTGTISYLYDQGLTARALAANRPASTPISEQAAITRATMVLKAAGALGEVDAPVTILNQLDEPPTFAGHTWTVVCKRSYRGIPYRNQQATVILLAETGQIVGMGLAYTTTPARQSIFRINAKRAVDVANRTMVHHGISGLQPSRVFKEFVQPNRRWSKGTMDLVGKANDPPAPAWHVELRAGNQIYEVWIDSLDASVIGGELSMIRGGRGRTSARPR